MVDHVAPAQHRAAHLAALRARRSDEFAFIEELRSYAHEVLIELPPDRDA